MAKSILWTNNHLESSYCKEVIKQMRKGIETGTGECAEYQGIYYKVSLVDKIVENGTSYNRIRLYYI